MLDGTVIFASSTDIDEVIKVSDGTHFKQQEFEFVLFNDIWSKKRTSGVMFDHTSTLFYAFKSPDQTSDYM